MCELHLTSLNVCKVHAKGNTLPRFLETFPVSVASTSRFLWFCFSLLFLLPLFQPIRFKADWTLINLVWFNDTWEKSSWSLAIPSSHKFKQSAYQCKREYHQVFQEFHLGMLSKPLVMSHFLVRYLFPCWSDLHTNCLEACGSQSIWNHKSNEFDIFSGQHYLRKAHGKWSSSLWDYSLKKKNHSQISLLMLTMR